MTELENKPAYNGRILQIKHCTFTSLVFSINGSMEGECQRFYSRLEEMISKRETFRSRFQVIGLEQKFVLGC